MKKQITIVLCVFMAFGMSYAQTGDNKIQKIKNAFRSESFQLSGYGHLIYNLSEYSERSLTPGKTNSSIDIARVMLMASGKLGENNQFGYMLVYDFGPNSRLFELYGEWLKSKAFNVRLGQFKTSFTIENPMSLSRAETVNLSRPASAMNGAGGDFNQLEQDGRIINKTGRDAGIQLYGSLFPSENFYRLEYYAGLYNGTGMNSKDNNNFKDFIGTIYFNPMKDFKLGGSVYFGKYPEYMQFQLLGNSLSTNRWTVGAEYKGSKLYSRAEYIQSNDGDLKRNGYYGLLMYKPVPDKWEIVGKYDYYNKDTLFENKPVRDITLGVNYYFAYLSRIQLNYIYTDDKAVGTNNALAVQLQVFF